MFYATERAETKIPLIIKSSKHKKNKKKRKKKKKTDSCREQIRKKHFPVLSFLCKNFAENKEKAFFPFVAYFSRKGRKNEPEVRTRKASFQVKTH